MPTGSRLKKTLLFILIFSNLCAINSYAATEGISEKKKFNYEFFKNLNPEHSNLNELVEIRHEIETFNFEKLSQIKKTESHIELQKMKISDKKKLLALRFRALYQMKQFPVLARLLSKNIHLSLQNIRTITFLAHRDINLIAEYNDLLLALREEQKNLKIELDSIQKLSELLKSYDESINIKIVDDNNKSFLISNKGKLKTPVSCQPSFTYGPLPNPDDVYIFLKGHFYDCNEVGIVRSVAPGRVVHLNKDVVNGLVLILDHGGNFYSVYSGLRSSFVELNSLVSNEQSLGSAGSFELLDKRGLYFELRFGETPLNPAQWIKN